MKEWKVGDEIEILRGESDYYDVGAKGVLVEYDGEDWYVDFTRSNPGEYNAFNDGHWFANAWRFDLSVQKPILYD